LLFIFCAFDAGVYADHCGLSLCLDPRSVIRSLTTDLGCVLSPLNMEGKTPSSGTAGLESGSQGALLLSRREQEGEREEERGAKYGQRIV